MLIGLLLSTALALGQTDSPVAEEPAPAPEATPAPPPPPPAAAAPDRWLLMRALQGTWEGSQLDENRMQIYGWTDFSYTFSTDQASNLPMAFNYRANQFDLQQNWVRFERSVVTSGTSEPTFGFRTDVILPGTDYFFTLPRYIFNEQLSANDGRANRYGIDPIQFYGEAYFPTIGQGMDVKVGRFFSQYGVENNPAVDNFFLSHSYTDLLDPFTQTGILTTTKITDAWSVQAGMVLGNDIFIGPADNATFVSSAKWVQTGNRNTVLLSVILDQGRFNQSHSFHNPEVIDYVYTHKVNTRMTYLFETLYGCTTDVPRIGFANWLGVVNYLTCDFTPRLSGTTRLEFFDDFQGDRTGFPGLYSALTMGLQFRPWRSVIIRPEVRYDYNYESRPFEGKPGLLTVASDVILRW